MGAHLPCFSPIRTLREKHEVNMESVILGTSFYIQTEHCTSDVLVCFNSGIALGNNFLVHLDPPFKSIALEAALPPLWR